MATYISNSAECPKCGGGHKAKPFCVYDNGYYCFSCGYSNRVDMGYTVREQVYKIPELGELEYNPEKFSIVNLQWLNKYFITHSTIRDFKIAQTHDGALVFPNIQNGEVVAWQKRYNGERRLITSAGAKVPYLISSGCTSVVLVEDYISAIRTSSVTDAVCLWGTKVSYPFLQSLFIKYTKILVWLDNDATKQTNSGQESAKIILDNLSKIVYSKTRRYGYGGVPEIEIKNVVTEYDPKCYTNTEIREIIGDCYAKSTK